MSNKSQNGRADRAHIFCGTPRDPSLDDQIFKNPRNFLHKFREIICFCFTHVYKEKMFTNEIEDLSKAP